MAETFTFGADFDFSKGFRTANEATKKVESGFNKIKIDFDTSGLNKMSGPLGKLSGQASEFSKSLEASNARVLAFGSSMGVLAAFSKGMKDLVTNGIEVQKTLAGINVVLNMSKEGLDSYSKQLFNVARNTGSNFKDIADGAKELARQGLGATESLKRLNDAAVLSRISGQSMKESIGTLTSVINSYNKEVISSTDLTNKLANISSRFAISGKDIADALERVGSSAQDAGVNIDQLIALITSAQHITNRGGDVIGNALKSIFQRVERNDTVEQLQAIGVAARDVTGNTRSAVDILKSLSDVYPTLNKSQQTFITELTGGVFQANQLKAVINDLSTGYSTYKQALDASISSSKTAYEQNEKLNQTFASKTNAIGQDYKQVTGKYGEMVAGPAINVASSVSKSATSILMGGGKKGELEGADFAAAFFKGVGNFVAGPGGVIFGAIVLGLIRKTSEFTRSAARNLIDVANGNDRVLDTQKKINQALANSGRSYSDLIAGAKNLEQVHSRILSVIQEQNAASEIRSGTTLGLAQNKSARPTINGRIGNFADPLREAIDREKKSGVSEKDIYVDSDKRLMSPSNPMGLLVANKRDEPLGGFQGVDRALAMGANPNIAQKIPNYAAYDKLTVMPGKTTLTGHESVINPDDARQLRSKMAKLREAAMNAETAIAHGLTEEINQFAKDIRLSDESQKVITKTLSKHSLALVEQEAYLNRPNVVRGGGARKVTPEEFAATRVDPASGGMSYDESLRRNEERNKRLAEQPMKDEKNRQNTILAQAQAEKRMMDRRARVTSIGIGASLAGSMASGVASHMGYEPVADIINSASTGLSVGAMTGNPYAAVAGAAAGAGLGAVKVSQSAPERAFKTAADEFQKLSAAVSASTNSAENYIRIQQQFDELLKSGSASEKDINELSKSLTTLFSEITDNKLKSDILSAGTDIKLLGERLGEFAKTQKMILSEKAIGVSVKGAEASQYSNVFGFKTGYRSEDLTEIAKNVVGAGKINKGNIGSLQDRFKQLSSGQDESGLAETLKSLSIPMDGIKDFFSRLELLGKAINEYDLAEQGKHLEESSKNYLNSLAKFQMEFSNLMNTRMMQKSVENTNVAAGQQVALSRANTAYSGFSGGLTESSKLPFEMAMKRQQIEYSGQQKAGSIDAQAKAGLMDIVRTSLAPKGMMGMMNKIDDPKISPEAIIKEMLSKGVGEFQGDKLKTAKEQLHKALDEYNKSTTELSIEQEKELGLLKEEETVRRESIRRQSLINSFGGTANFGKQIDVAGFAAGEKASAAVQHGEYLLGYRSMNQYQKSDLGASMNQARTTQAMSQIELAKMFPENPAVRSGEIQGNVATAIEYEDRQKLAQMTAGRLQSAFGGALQNNQLAGGVNSSAIGGISRDIFGLLKSVGPDGKSRGENRDYEGAGKTIMKRYGIKEGNPLYKQVMDILGQAGSIQGGIKEGAGLKARDMLPGGAEEKERRIFTSALESAKPLVDISIYTKATAERIKDLTMIMAGRGKVESANFTVGQLTKSRAGAYGNMVNSTNEFDEIFSGIKELKPSSADRFSFSQTASRIAGKDLSSGHLDSKASLARSAVMKSINKGGTTKEILDRINADKENTEAFTRQLSPNNENGSRDRKIKELIVASSGSENKGKLESMIGIDENIKDINLSIKSMSEGFDRASETVDKANKSLEEAVDNFNSKTTGGGKGGDVSLNLDQKISGLVQVVVTGMQDSGALQDVINNAIKDHLGDLQGQIDELKGGMPKPSKVT